MTEENKDKGERDPIKLLLEEAIEWQRSKMMDKFSRSFDECQ